MTAVKFTTVADDLVVWHDHGRVGRAEGLRPSTEYTFEGHQVTTLARPDGELLARFATVNDVHFGEVECGRLDQHTQGPILSVEPHEPPYPETMNRAAVAEMRQLDLDAVVVKGDLTEDGTDEQFAAFEDCYRTAFGERLHVVRGNHDSYRGQQRYFGDRWIELPGVAIALLDTVIPSKSTGTLTADQLAWLDTHAAVSDRPVVVLGHHQQWITGHAKGDPSEAHRADTYFGLHPDASDALNEVAARRTSIVAYAAGHTHRHRLRHMACGVPSIEIGCVKDFPGTWAEYRVYEGGITQVVHRISAPDALAWSERCRHLYSDFGLDYASYALGTLEDRCCNIPLR